MKQKLWIVTTVADSLDSLLEGQSEFLNQYFDVTIVSLPSDRLANVAEREGVGWQAVEMRRTISPFHDLFSIWRMFRLLRKNRPEIIQSYTPKAGLVTMIAGSSGPGPSASARNSGNAFDGSSRDSAVTHETCRAVHLR